MSEKISTLLNGKPHTFHAELETPAIDLIRNQAGLTGTKLVCGSGACGACTVLVDGEARCACLMPGVQMDGKNIQTVEGHGEKELHPIQKAFLAHDALQCGYCTPGFINEGVAFYDTWRAEKGKRRPSRAEIAEALAGHLCRCGAYQGIFNAVAAACAGDFDDSKMPTYYRVDAVAKVSGAAKYTTDYQLPGQLVGAIYRSPFPHARMSNLDISKAERMPGVKAVVVLKKDDTCRYEGEAIVAVAAETEDQAHQAALAVKADFEPLDFVVDPKEARKKSCPVIVPEDKKAIGVASEGPPFPGAWEGNLRRTRFSLTSSHKGRVKRELEKTADIPENCFHGSFTTPTQFHTPFEPHCTVADWRADGKLTVYASTQAVYFLAKDIAKHFGLKDEQVEVVADYIGGAFGSKLTFRTETLTAIELSRAAKAPVAVIYNRAEELLETGFRPPGEMEVDIASDPDGKNAAFEMHAYGSSGLAFGSNIADVAGMNYTGIAKKLQDYDVLTNFSPGCAFRAPGGPAACFALEQSIDQLAHQLKMDPVAFRRVWEEHEGYKALFDWVDAQELWRNRKASGSQTGRFRKGVGVAFGAWFHFFMPSAEVEVELRPEGLVVSNAVQDMGQGSKSVLAQAVAEVFGIASQNVRVEAGRSTYSIGPTSGGSRTATSIFPAAQEAAEKVRARLLGLAEKQGFEGSEFKETGIQHRDGLWTWEEILKGGSAIKEKARRGPNKGVNPLGLLPLAQGLSIGKDRGYGVYVIEVEVDSLLGKVRVTQVRGAMRVGKIHVRALAESQCYGGVIQGIGHALYEDRSVDPNTGRLLTRGLEDYRIPGIGDTPDIQVDFIEQGFEFAKGKGIGLAELCTVPVAGAVANAVFNATGWRPMTAPILPERVLAGLSAT